MATLARVLSEATRGLRRRIHTHPPPPPHAAAATPLLERLMRETDSGVKIALEEEEERERESSMATCQASFWEPLAVALRSSAPKKAQLVLEWKLEKLLKERVLEREPYLKLISLCELSSNVQFALRVFTSMEAQGIQPNTSIFNALLTLYLSTGDIVTALSLFEIMDGKDESKPDFSTYSAFISAFSRLGDAHSMVSWYFATKKAGFSPTTRTYEYLITGLTKLGKFEDADRFFNEMLSVEILPNLSILEAKIEGLCKRKDVGGVREFLKFVINRGWELNEAMAEKLSRFYMDLGLVEEMEQLLGLIRKGTCFDVSMRLHCGVARLYANSDQLDQMEFAVMRMLEGGMIFGCPEDIEAVICSYFRRKAFNRLDLFLDRIRNSYELTRSTYDLLVAGYRKFELYERLDLIIKDMKIAGFA
ncbi:pentatricopeptide repeat-containing protein At2g30780-like [Ananas comosus]|uniref:Pentatricopeptide repeat-containing protein At2g30780-like n=1 Tax=Ananas comosus TaxID=4615 RepID=A0A6P5GD45_ANACO|nr:pentatricopeptide repeat-containing protein At2g30780-like [Ananas comosus]